MLSTTTAVGEVFKEEENAKDDELISDVSDLLGLGELLLLTSTNNFVNQIPRAYSEASCLPNETRTNHEGHHEVIKRSIHRKGTRIPGEMSPNIIRVSLNPDVP